MMEVWGVWSGRYEAELVALFTTRELAEAYAQARNTEDVAHMNAHLADMAAKYREEGNVMFADLYDARRWKPQCWTKAHPVYDATPDADLLWPLPSP